MRALVSCMVAGLAGCLLLATATEAQDVAPAGDLSAQKDQSLEQLVKNDGLIQVLGAKEWTLYNHAGGWRQMFDVGLALEDNTYWVKKDDGTAPLQVAAPADLAAFLARICTNCTVEQAGKTFPSVEVEGQPTLPLGTGSGGSGVLITDSSTGTIAIVPEELLDLIKGLCTSCTGGDAPKGVPVVVGPKTTDCTKFPKDPRCGGRLEPENSFDLYGSLPQMENGTVFLLPDHTENIVPDTVLYGPDLSLALPAPPEVDGQTLTGVALDQWKWEYLNGLQKQSVEGDNELSLGERLQSPVTLFSRPVEMLELNTQH